MLGFPGAVGVNLVQLAILAGHCSLPCWAPDLPAAPSSCLASLAAVARQFLHLPSACQPSQHLAIAPANHPAASTLASLPATLLKPVGQITSQACCTLTNWAVKSSDGLHCCFSWTTSGLRHLLLLGLYSSTNWALGLLLLSWTQLNWASLLVLPSVAGLLLAKDDPKAQLGFCN